MLLNDGTDSRLATGIAAPYQSDHVNNYAVEAEIQGMNPGAIFFEFGIIAREGYRLGVDDTFAKIWRDYYRLGGGNWVEIGATRLGTLRGWHTYRAEMNGNRVRLLVDGSLAVEVTDNMYLSAGRVGLWSSTQVSVRSFRVIAL